MTPSNKLRAARDLISDPERWCQGSLAERADGERCSIKSKLATKWCAVGACTKMNVSTDYIYQAGNLMGGIDAAEINDEHGHSNTLKMFDLAIELAEKEG